MKPTPSFDLTLLGQEEIFRKINEQTNLIIDLFTDLANEFPQEYLLKYHPFSKGVKVSKGLQLEGLPYQVLDLVRDFHQENGFNIRVLHWWGKGLFIFISFGKEYSEKARGLLGELEGTFKIFPSPDIFDYACILKNPDNQNYVQENNIRQLYMALALKESPNILKEEIRQVISRTLEYPW